MPVALSIIHEGKTDIDEYVNLLNHSEVTEIIDDHIYTIFPLGAFVWNMDLDTDLSMIWNWNDLQFLRGFNICNQVVYSF